jgi:hypothetical protein
MEGAAVDAIQKAPNPVATCSHHVQGQISWDVGKYRGRGKQSQDYVVFAKCRDSVTCTTCNASTSVFRGFIYPLPSCS